MKKYAPHRLEIGLITGRQSSVTRLLKNHKYRLEDQIKSIRIAEPHAGLARGDASTDFIVQVIGHEGDVGMPGCPASRWRVDCTQ
ncbi:hypothetical protein ACVBGC_11920 [Burkholderia stagnalis]